MSEKIKTEVRVKGYEETTNPNEILITENLDSCVGFGLVTNLDRQIKRGLAHIYYGGDVEYIDKKPFRWSKTSEKRRFAAIKEVDAVRIINRLEEIFEKFRTLPGSGKNSIRWDKINSYIIANRTKEEGVAVEGDEGFTNPAFDLVSNWAINQGAKLKLSDSVYNWNNESNNEDRNKHSISYKSVILKESGIQIIYKDLNNKWLNSNTSLKHL